MHPLTTLGGIMEKKYIVRLTQEERRNLLTLISKGKASARKLVHARVLLEADVSETEHPKTDKEIAEILHIDDKSVKRVRKRLVEEGLEAALNRKEHKNRKARRFDGNSEAHLVALCCSKAPEGRQRWTIRLLADKLVELNIVDEVSPATVYRTLKKTKLNLGKKRNGVFHRRRMQNSSAKWKMY
jgi:transposase